MPDQGWQAPAEIGPTESLPVPRSGSEEELRADRCP